MDNTVLIFMVGCSVFALTIGSAFVALIGSDKPNDNE